MMKGALMRRLRTREPFIHAAKPNRRDRPSADPSRVSSRAYASSGDEAGPLSSNRIVQL